MCQCSQKQSVSQSGVEGGPPTIRQFFSRPSQGGSRGSEPDLAVQSVSEEIFAIPPQVNMGQLKSLTRFSLCVEGILSVALLDTGSCANIISSQRFQNMQQLQCCDRDSFSVAPFERVLYSANNKAIPMSGIVTLNVEVGPLKLTNIPFLLSNSDVFSDELCLGRPFINLFDSITLQKDHILFTQFHSTPHVSVESGNHAEVELLTDVYQAQASRFKFYNIIDVVIPAMTGTQLPVMAPCVYDTPPPNTTLDFYLEPHPGLSSNVGLAALTAVVGQGSVVTVPLLNPSPYDVWLKKGEELGLVRQLSGEIFTPQEFMNQFKPNVDPTQPLSEDNGVTFQERVEFLDKNLNLDSGDLTPPQKQDLKDILYEYADIVSTGDMDIGRTHLAEHIIDTGNARPIFQKPYRVEFKNREVIEKEVEKMLAIDLIEPCKSPWASPVVLIPKPDGSIRFCIDFRKINKVTVRDAFPLPRIDDIIPLLGKKNFFVGLDMACGYWQVPVSESLDSKNKTAFTCHVGTYRFKYMPFGGVNCPATFQRLMQEVLAGQYNKTVFCYLDDILVTGTTWKELMVELRVVFQKLREGHLKLKLRKCEFGKTKIGYLGHMIDHDGYSPKPNRVKPILEIIPPTTVGECRRLIGLFGFYSKFIPHYSDLMRPIQKLLQHKSLGLWTDQCQESLDKLKHALTNAPILAFPDFSRPFKLYCDASAEALGSVLAQVQEDGLEHPLGYHSKALTDTESRYSNTEREMLSVYCSLKHFYPILYGRTVTVYTDHIASVHLFNQIEPSKRAAIFQQNFQGEIDWTVEHVKGKENVVADCLSRFPTFQESQEKLKNSTEPKPQVAVVTRSTLDTQKPPPDFPVVDSATPTPPPPPTPTPTPPPNTPTAEESEEEEAEEAEPTEPTSIQRWKERCRREQEADPQLAHIINFLREGVEPPNKAQKKKLMKNLDHYFINDEGILMYDDLKETENSDKIFVPRSMQKELLEVYHGPQNAGHPGRDKLCERVKRYFFWYGIKPTVFKFLQNCLKCKQFKNQGTPEGPLNPILANESWEILNVDICGPFPTSTRGNRYVIGFIDSFTRYALTFPVVEINAQELAKIYLEEVCYKHGPAKRLISDQGTQFTSKITNEIMKLMKTDHSFSDIYHPQTNGKIERFWGTLKTEIKMYANENSDNWDEALPALTYAYNCNLSKPTQFSPFQAVFGRKPRLPFEMMLLPSSKESKGFSQFTKDHIRTLKQISKSIGKNNAGYGQKFKLAHDKNIRMVEFRPGQKVLVKEFRRTSMMDPKFGPDPYVVMWVSPNGASAIIALPEDHFQGWKVSTNDLKMAPTE